MPNMPNNVKKRWTLSVAPNPGGTLPPPVQALNSGTLDIFGQHRGPNAAADFDILTIKVTDVNAVFQLASGAIDANNNVEFIFLSNGKEDGQQFVFKAGRQSGNDIKDGRIFGPPKSGGDEDIGTWSGTSGGGVEDREAYR